METNLSDVAKAVKLEKILVRDILTEKHGIKVTKETQDLVFTTARKMGYEFKKLKIGKRMNLRKEIIQGLIDQIKAKPKWKRREIMEYMQNSCDMVERVHKRTFKEEFVD